MFSVLALFRALLSWMRGSRTSRDAEILFLRQQLLVLKRMVPARLRLRNSDRLIFVWLYRLFPSLLDSAAIFKPETLVRWHRKGFCLLWRSRPRRPAGRPAVSSEIRSLLRQTSRENPLWGAPRIHGELLKLGIAVSQSSVAKYMGRRRRPRHRAGRRSSAIMPRTLPLSTYSLCRPSASNCYMASRSFISIGDIWSGPMSPRTRQRSGSRARSPRHSPGTRRLDTSFAIGIAPMAPSSRKRFGRRGSGTDPSRLAHRGKMAMSSG